MSNDFWAKRLGGQQPAQQPQQPAQGSHAWWRLGQPATPTTPAVAPPTVPQGDELAGHDFSGASHLKQSGTCPECGESLAVTGKVTTRNGVVEAQRCTSCGWPVKNSTQDLNGVTGGQADAASRQIATGGLTNNYQPQNTIAGAIRSPGDLRR